MLAAESETPVFKCSVQANEGATVRCGMHPESNPIDTFDFIWYKRDTLLAIAPSRDLKPVRGIQWKVKLQTQ